MENVWLASALWIGLALLASIISIRTAISVALVEILVGAVAGNAIGLDITPWVNFLAGFGAIMLTFLAGTEIDSEVMRRKLGPSIGIGVASFAAPYSRALHGRASVGALRRGLGLAGIASGKVPHLGYSEGREWLVKRGIPGNGEAC